MSSKDVACYIHLSTMRVAYPSFLSLIRSYCFCLPPQVISEHCMVHYIDSAATKVNTAMVSHQRRQATATMFVGESAMIATSSTSPTFIDVVTHSDLHRRMRSSRPDADSCTDS